MLAAATSKGGGQQGRAEEQPRRVDLKDERQLRDGGYTHASREDVRAELSAEAGAVWLGEVAFLEGEGATHPASVVAATTGRALVWESAALRELFAADRAAHGTLLSLLGGQVAEKLSA